jgi:hypothetical protein
MRESPHIPRVTRASVEAAKAAARAERTEIFHLTGVVINEQGFIVPPASERVH